MVTTPRRLTSSVTLSTEGKYASEACWSTGPTRRDEWCTNIMVVFTTAVFLAFPINVLRRRGDRTFQECFKATTAKKQRLEADGWVVEVMWECQWMKCLKEAQGTLEEWLTRWNPMTPLEPRDAFFGGRTNAVKLHHRCGEGERILYQDVTSLYPWVNKYALYPTGHPSIITTFADDRDLRDYFGLVKLTVLPPRGLYHPVLPLRQGGKLTFPLCRTCVETQMSVTLAERSYRCPHDDQQRQLTGTWCTPEVREALRRGYSVVKIHEVWHFPPNQQKFGLFRDYVNKWLKNKTEASGYPHWTDSAEKKQSYISAYAEKEGIHLDADNITKNPGRKATAKLMLNSFWGKFGENLRKSSTRQVTTPAKLYALVTDPLKEVTDVRVYSDEVLERRMRREWQDEFVRGRLHDLPCTTETVFLPTRHAAKSVVF